MHEVSVREAVIASYEHEIIMCIADTNRKGDVPAISRDRERGLTHTSSGHKYMFSVGRACWPEAESRR